MPNTISVEIRPVLPASLKRLEELVGDLYFTCENEVPRLFLFLDETLGEYGTQQWIGEIKVNNERLDQSMPLSELLEFTAQLEREKGWKTPNLAKIKIIYDKPKYFDFNQKY